MERTKCVPLRVVLSFCLLAVGPAHAQTFTWSPIDCAKSSIVLDGITKCQESNSYAGSDGRSDYHLQTAAFTTATERVYVFLQKPRVELETGGIAVPDEAVREKYLSKPSADAGKSGRNLSPTMRMNGGYAKTYALEGGWQCFSYSKDAPPLGRSNGVAYYLVGYVCAKTPQVQTADTINAFLQKLSVRR